MLRALELFGVATVTTAGLALAYIAGIPLAVGFSLGLVLLIVFMMKKGVPAAQVAKQMVIGAGHTKEVVWILLLVGLIIPAWTASGTIPYMIHVGLSLFDPSLFLTFAFLFTAAVSMTLGTSTGTLSAVGIPLIGMAAYLDIPLAMAAGALASGAFVGDRSSPFSSAHQLVAASTGVTVGKQSIAMLPTTAGALAISVLFYAFLDWQGNWQASRGMIDTSNLSAIFHFSPLLFIPPAILIGAIVLRMKVRYGFLLAIAAGIVIGSVVQHVSLAEWLSDLWHGYDNDNFSGLQGKGVSDMIDLVILIALAGSFNGILEESKAILPYVEKLLGNSRSLAASTFRTMLFGLVLGLVSCTQTLPIMMSGRNLLPVWNRRHDSAQLARVVADTGLIFAAMVPWNMLAILCSTVMGVAVESYVPFAVFLWSLPALTMLVSIYIGRKEGQGIRNEN